MQYFEPGFTSALSSSERHTFSFTQDLKCVACFVFFAWQLRLLSVQYLAQASQFELGREHHFGVKAWGDRCDWMEGVEHLQDTNQLVRGLARCSVWGGLVASR